MTTQTSIDIDHRCIEGIHIFTAVALPGLYVAHTDVAIAFNDVSPSIETLIQLNEHVRCKATPEVTLEQFLSTSTEQAQAALKAANISSKRFLLSRELEAA